MSSPTPNRVPRHIQVMRTFLRERPTASWPEYRAYVGEQLAGKNSIMCEDRRKRQVKALEHSLACKDVFFSLQEAEHVRLVDESLLRVQEQQSAAQANQSAAHGTLLNHILTKRPGSPLTSTRPATRRVPCVNPERENPWAPEEEDQRDEDDEDDAEVVMRQPVFLDIDVDVQFQAATDEVTFRKVNVSQQFFAYQKAAYKTGSTQGLTLESNVHELLALSSMLLLRTGEHSLNLLKFYDESFLDDFRDHLLSEVGFSVPELSEDLEMFLRRMCKNIAKVGYLDDDADAKLLHRMIDSPAEKRILDTFRGCFTSLPTKPIVLANDSESDLMTTLLHPFLRPFLSNRSNIRLGWPNTQSTAACKAKAKTEFSSGRARQPDMKLFTIKASQEHFEVGYGEVKPHSAQGDTFALNLDLLRLGKFAKMAIDNLVEEGISRPIIPVVQAVGNKLCLYFAFLHGDGLYTLVEAGRLAVPTSLNEMLPLVDSIAMLDAFSNVSLRHIEKISAESDNITPSVPRSYLRPTWMTPAMLKITKTTRDRRRRSFVRHQ
ncbi:hypothetical protein HDU85_006461 [Gaertneriomyces sp. JEL0708]|nr:hypothetical protein HDU85_006461 [Gaertneriomyces sp. JEL0708]